MSNSGNWNKVQRALFTSLCLAPHSSSPFLGFIVTLPCFSSVFLVFPWQTTSFLGFLRVLVYLNAKTLGSIYFYLICTVQDWEWDCESFTGTGSVSQLRWDELWEIWMPTLLQFHPVQAHACWFEELRSGSWDSDQSPSVYLIS